MAEAESGIRDTHQFVSFRLCGEEYGIRILQVQEIIRYEELTRIPQSEEFIEGVLNLRGRVVPVIDLRKRFELVQSERDNATRIVVVEIDNQVVGLVVDAVNEVQTIEENQIDPPPPLGTGISAEYIYGMGKIEDRLIILLNIERILKEEEKAAMAEVAA